ncbi:MULTISPECIES: ankyrin repeat domain-containing protein [Psychrilyobacter]|uniref:Ankyrin repeat domain-containing protein n=1 Tax=Psychrilyobacter piezotolerans TaxID=2293438 RepID=A0ABX9KKI0_9FUSO|nr:MULTISPECIES: ankyrin repeat domain-containing protein [Psychrilyobacter]MCS5423209.1 ankyrin repeat domain-containing protein [Psychrilyobacter sp. S5]NDI76762.1 ankyrin repeat domain-containing protein [Psychrilyobacter piezotolerans]RDE65380.1 ankyrin repeat domain-containing protein [Psychrilyobacter sp. S5]REI42998.1 ankyrin repeat domain-containing protein [Psychrilyobacter piezotolerans]
MKKILITIILGTLLLSCSGMEKEKTIKVDKIEIPYSMVEQSIDLDDAMSLKLFLENGFNPNYIGEDGETLLMKIVKNNSLKSLKVIISHGVDLEAETPPQKKMNTTSYDPNKRAVDFVKTKKALDILVEAGADINYINNLGVPLIINFIKEKPTSYVEKLILEGADPDTADKSRWTPLMWAASKRNKEVVKLLIANGADINITDDRRNSAVYYAYDEDTIRMFLTKNLNLYYKNKDGENVLGEVYLRSISNSYYGAVEDIIKIGGDKNYSSYGDTPMGIARENKDKKMVELLSKLGVKEDEKY